MDDDLLPALPPRSGLPPLLSASQDSFVPTPMPGDVDDLLPDVPVVAVPCVAAERYAAWRGGATGRAYRLPHDLMWEKAARGVDGRFFPWGQRFDAAFTGCRESFKGRPGPRPAGTFPDESPYGVRDTAGNVRDMCSNDFTKVCPRDPRVRVDGAPGESQRMLRGGAFSTGAPHARVASRWVTTPDARSILFGFRLVLPVRGRA